MTPPLTHTTTGTTVTVSAQSTPATCPAWCAGGHDGPDPKHYGAWIHESRPRSVAVEEGTGTLLITLSRFDELELPAPDTIGITHVLIAPRLKDHLAEYFLTCDEAQAVLGALADVVNEMVNETLPPGEQTFLGPPGFEYVRDDFAW